MPVELTQEQIESYKKKFMARLKDYNQTPDEILNSPRPMEHIKPLLDDLVCGEDYNKQVLFILLLSGKLSDPKKKVMVLIKSEPGVGKTTILNALTKLFTTKKVARFSQKGMDYSDLSNYDVLYIQELGHADVEKFGLSTVKFLSSDDGGYTVEVTMGDIKEGFTTVQKKIPPITMVSSTIRVYIDNQFERRCWILQGDESPEQTEAIRRWKAKQRIEENEVLLGIRHQTSRERASIILKNLVQKLEPIKVLILFPLTITEFLDRTKTRTRGDYDKLMLLIEFYCMLKQRTLPSIETLQGPVKVATAEAAIEVLQIAKEPIIRMTMELDKRTEKLLERLELMGITEPGQTLSPDLRDQLSIELGYASRTIRAYLSELVRRGYMTDDNKRPKTYKLTSSLSLIRHKESAFSAKMENTEYLKALMCKEAQNSLRELSARTNFEGLEKLMDHFKYSPEALLTEIEQSQKLKQKGKLLQYMWQNQELPTTEHKSEVSPTRSRLLSRPKDYAPFQEWLNYLVQGIHYFRNSQNELIEQTTLKSLLNWPKDTPNFDNTLRIAERDGAIFQPHPGYWKALQ